MPRSFPFRLKQTITALVLSAFVASCVSAMTRPALDPQDVVVDRTHKGDRPMHALANRQSEPAPISIREISQLKQVPLGCDRSFSPIAQPELAYVFKRCMV